MPRVPGAWRAFLATSPRPTLAILRYGVPASWAKITGGTHADAARSAPPATTSPREARLRGSEPYAYAYPLIFRGGMGWECNVGECLEGGVAATPAVAGDAARKHLADRHG